MGLSDRQRGLSAWLHIITCFSPLIMHRPTPVAGLAGNVQLNKVILFYSEFKQEDSTMLFLACVTVPSASGSCASLNTTLPEARDTEYDIREPRNSCFEPLSEF